MTPDTNVAPVAGDCECLTCGYNLRGLRPDGRCPECGSPADPSVRAIPQARMLAGALLWIETGSAIYLLGLLTLVTYPITAIVGRMVMVVGERRLDGWRAPRPRPKLSPSGSASVLFTCVGWMSVAFLFDTRSGAGMYYWLVCLACLAIAEILAFGNWISLFEVSAQLADAVGVAKTARRIERLSSWLLICGGSTIGGLPILGLASVALLRMEAYWVLALLGLLPLILPIGIALHIAVLHRLRRLLLKRATASEADG